eukprot:m.32842 g.32842  ORF g.32842 m.32842 type:complete len:96 (-) comp12472_c0_seq1:16-303(-)
MPMHDLKGGRHSDVRTGRGSRSRLLHSVYDMPSANPNPSVTGHGRLLNKTTEKSAPNPVPTAEFLRRLLTHRSVFCPTSAILPHSLSLSPSTESL